MPCEQGSEATVSLIWQARLRAHHNTVFVTAPEQRPPPPLPPMTCEVPDDKTVQVSCSLQKCQICMSCKREVKVDADSIVNPVRPGTSRKNQLTEWAIH